MKSKLDQRLTIRLAWTEKGWLSLAARRLGITPSQAVRCLVRQAIASDSNGMGDWTRKASEVADKSSGAHGSAAGRAERTAGEQGEAE